MEEGIGRWMNQVGMMIGCWVWPRPVREGVVTGSGDETVIEVVDDDKSNAKRSRVDGVIIGSSSICTEELKNVFSSCLNLQQQRSACLLCFLNAALFSLQQAIP